MRIRKFDQNGRITNSSKRSRYFFAERAISHDSGYAITRQISVVSAAYHADLANSSK